MQSTSDLSDDEKLAAWRDFYESRLDPEMVALWRRYDAAVAKGYAEGYAEGFTKGRNEQARVILEGQLAQRFGALSQATRARIEAATLTELNAMTLRVLTAATVDEVLGA